MKQTPQCAMTDIARNIKQIRELKSLTQEYMAGELGISQPAYVKIEQGLTVLKIDRLQLIADILEVDLSTLLNTTNIFNIVFQAEATQSGYINTQNNHNTLDIETLRKIIQEEINKNK
ncbi:MAG: helix-turn-helix domain-containing protein [Candidatus Symbiothrix sp.]|jgi:transcriptional regulator with XRE-family HTH domain|nr:helix-turn-helix domain-containing protein [Candidatus Symbiothrix sp.]